NRTTTATSTRSAPAPTSRCSRWTWHFPPIRSDRSRVMGVRIATDRSVRREPRADPPSVLEAGRGRASRGARPGPGWSGLRQEVVAPGCLFGIPLHRFELRDKVYGVERASMAGHRLLALEQATPLLAAFRFAR